MRYGPGWPLLLPLLLLAGCQRDADGNLRDAYERMMASAERRAADTVQAVSPRPEAPAETLPASLPIDTLPAAAAAPAPPEPPVVEPPPARDTFPLAFEGTAGIEQRRRAGAPATLREVRSAPHDGFDRVVFEFEGGSPGYHVEHVDRPIRECGSGRGVQVAGQGWLRVRLEPARAHETVGESARVTVASRSRSLDYPLLRQLTLTCDFEGQVEWVLGLAAPNRYRVLELVEPPRLVVDVLH